MNVKNLYCTNKYSFTENTLNEFIINLPHAAHIKDIKTWKYILSNEQNAKFYNAKSIYDLIGITIHDLDDFMRPCWGEEYARIVSDLDLKTKQYKHPVRDHNRILLSKNGHVMIQNMVKYPLIGINNKVNAILTYTYDLVSDLSLYELFHIYLRIYQSKKDGVSYFLNYLQVDKSFIRVPTESEIKVLIMMVSEGGHKTISNKLGISPKTVEAHVSKIRKKLKQGDLFNLLRRIRNESRR